MILKKPTVILTIFLLCVSILSYNWLFGKRARYLKKALQIPEEDRKILEDYFYYLTTSTSFGYVLFGDKPLFFEHYPENPSTFSISRLVNSQSTYHLKKGWETWQKYSHLFLSKDFIFKKIPSKSGYQFIVFANKKRVERILKENRELILEVFGATKNPQNFIDEIEKNFIYFEDIFGDNDRLIGLILGYGKKGPKLFQDYWKLEQEIHKNNSSPLYPCDPSLKSKADRILSLTMSGAQQGECWIARIDRVAFLSDPSDPETLSLKALYRQNQDKLLAIHQQDSFLEMILNQLSHPL